MNTVPPVVLKHTNSFLFVYVYLESGSSKTNADFFPCPNILGLASYLPYASVVLWGILHSRHSNVKDPEVQRCFLVFVLPVEIQNINVLCC